MVHVHHSPAGTEAGSTDDVVDLPDMQQARDLERIMREIAVHHDDTGRVRLLDTVADRFGKSAIRRSQDRLHIRIVFGALAHDIVGPVRTAIVDHENSITPPFRNSRLDPVDERQYVSGFVVSRQNDRDILFRRGA